MQALWIHNCSTSLEGMQVLWAEILKFLQAAYGMPSEPSRYMLFLILNLLTDVLLDASMNDISGILSHFFQSHLSLEAIDAHPRLVEIFPK